MPKRKNYSQEDIDKIIYQYQVEKKSLRKIGEYFGVSPNPIKRILLENNISIRTSSEGLRQDLTNQKFGKLTVIKLDPNHIPESGKHAYWLCKCECGTEVLVASQHLKSGAVSACSPGCKHRIAKGTRFGRLTVLEPTEKRSKNGGSILYECLCDCGQEILVPSTELRAGRKGACDLCTESLGEATIRTLLENNKEKFEQEKIFSNCFYLDSAHPLRFDFYVYTNNQQPYLIEYDGIQHFETNNWFGGEQGFKNRKIRDELKNKYCKENNIPLIRIPYTHLKDLNIQDLKIETSKFIVK